MIKPPTEQEIHAFVSTTHSIDRIPLYAEQIQSTWRMGQPGAMLKGKPNPYAQGHFRAIMYAIHTLIPSTDFPAKAPELLTTIGSTETALFWLKTLHSKMVEPLVGHELLDSDVNAPTKLQVGKYRIHSAMAVMRPAPEPSIIPALMHNWLVDYGTFHAKIKDKLSNPYAFDKETAQTIVQKAHEVNLFFCTVQPMACLNQRMGRLMENVFRIAWSLPMKIFSPESSEYRQMTADLQRYEAIELPKLVTRIKDVRG